MRINAMKSVLGLSLAAFLFAGCDLFEEVDDVTFDIEIQHTFVIDASENDPLEYFDFGEFDATKDANFDKYKDKIKEFKVHTIEFTVTDYAADGDVIFSDGYGIFYPDAAETSAIASAEIPIQSIAGAQGTVHTLDYQVAGLDAIADQLESVHKIYFLVKGKVSDVPVAFKVPVTLKATITADALE